MARTACPVPVGLNLTSQKLVLTKISNKRPFLAVKGVGAHSRGGCLFEDLRYKRIIKIKTKKLQDKFSPLVTFPCTHFDLTSNMNQTWVSNRSYYPYVLFLIVYFKFM